MRHYLSQNVTVKRMVERGSGNSIYTPVFTVTEVWSLHASTKANFVQSDSLVALGTVSMEPNICHSKSHLIRKPRGFILMPEEKQTGSVFAEVTINNARNVIFR